MTTLIGSRQVPAYCKEHLLSARTYRSFSCGNVWASGHSRWSKIKHDKGKADAEKAKQRTTIASQLIQASKRYGPDPNINLQLATAIAMAKKQGLPKATIEASIARGQGKSATGAILESLTMEVMMPQGLAAVIECQTDSRQRTLNNVREAVRAFGGSVTPVAYMFERKGKITFDNSPIQEVDVWKLSEKISELEAVDEEKILEAAFEAGALDVEVSKGKTIVYTDPAQTGEVSEALEGPLQLKLESAELIWEPKEDTKIEFDSLQTVEWVQKFISRLEEEAGVQDIYLNAD